jgi:hypothetical protein
MNYRLWTNLAVPVGLIVFSTPCWSLQDKLALDHLPTTSVCVAPTADPIVSTKAFYVAVTGNDANEGTIDSPWKTIQHAADTVEAGDTVYIRGGVYHESVGIEVSGSAEAGPVTFQNYPAEEAILDGTGLTPSTTDIEGLINIEDESYVTVRGLEIRNYQATNAAATPTGIWITGTGSHIQIQNNHVHHIGTTAEAAGNAMGIAVYGTESTGALDSISISDNQVHDLKTGNSESVTVNGNVTNFAINCNVVHDVDNTGIAAVGLEEVAPDPASDYARNGVISRNTLYKISSKKNPAEKDQYNADGISVDSGSQIVIERNLVYDVDVAIEIAGQHKGHNAHDVTARNNLVYHANSVGITIGGYSRNVGGADHCTIVNNTLFQNDTKSTGGGEFQIQFHANNNVFKNNIVFASSQGLFINDDSKEGPEPADLDYNLYTSQVPESKAQFIWRGNEHEGFSAYLAAAGRDKHSKYADQKVLSLEMTDPRLEPPSAPDTPGVASNAVVNGSLNFVSENPRVSQLLENSEEGPYVLRSRHGPYAVRESGLYVNVNQVNGHDSFVGYSSELDLSVGFDFGRVLEVESGVPFYFVSATNTPTATNANHLSYRNSAFGDAFVKVALNPLARFDYGTTLTVTAPTGTANVSTGQATWDWNNRVENDLWIFHPFGEFVLGNVPAATPRLESYKISGAATQLHAGNTFDFGRLGAFDASFYESVPLGDATAYFASTEGAPLTRTNLLSDHGFTGDYSKSAGRVAFDLTYNRSIAHATDAVYLSIGYRIGHVRKERFQ